VATAAALRRQGGGRVAVERPIESLQREAATMRPVVYGTVALLIAIAALNLLTTLGLAVRERERDYAVLASVGATPRQVRATVIAGGAVLAFPAALLGLPLGAWIFTLVIGATDPADGPDVWALPGWWWYPVAIAGPWRSPGRSARSPRARRCGSARLPRCAPSRPVGLLPSGGCRSSRCSPWRAPASSRGRSTRSSARARW
jgi:hypothetical protein